MEEKPNYYAVIPANVRYDKDLRANEKLMYGEITALSSKYGECTASNNYFARLYEVQPSAISKWIKDLQSKEYISVEYQRKGKEIEKRIIKITGIHKCEYVFTKEEEGYSQKDKENNTSINNINNKEINKERYIDIQAVVDYLNLTLHTKYRYNSAFTKHINARFEEGYELDDFYDVIDSKFEEWHDTDMEKYLRPDTLFGTKFEIYVNQINDKKRL